MRKEDFYELLDIDYPAEFQYFENLAAFLECDEELEYEDVAELFQGVDKDTLAQLVDNYFEELTDFVPGSETGVYGILDNVRRALMGMARNCDDDTMETKLADELERFRRWYSIDSRVYLTNLGTMDEQEFTLRDALVNARIEKLDGDKFQYDFSECENYVLDEYIVSFGDMIAANEAEEMADTGEEDELYM
ncbi:MAG: hypothetical protein IKM19_09930 [Firmicutes bacterium]|nr:hypothetical protein [Bacillota bacterium]MBR6585078.1 hypothetical protein [Bacillota bacterium]